MALRKPFIGQLDRRISVFEMTKTQNEIGEEKETKSFIAKRWAKIESETGSEKVEGNVRNLSNVKFTIRYHSEIARRGNEMHVEFEGAMYNITHVAQIGRRDFLQLICFNYD